MKNYQNRKKTTKLKHIKGNRYNFYTVNLQEMFTFL